MFQKGQSGNPAGPAKGTRHKITMLAEKLLEDDRDDIVRAVIAAAKGGDSTAMRLNYTMPLTEVTKSGPPDQSEIEICIFGPNYGECIVIHLGDSRWIVVDSCVYSDTKEPVALAYLRELGVDPANAIKSLIVTHWHDDHCRGLSQLLRAAPTAHLCISSALTSLEFLKFATRMRKNKTPVAGTKLKEFSASIDEIKARNETGLLSFSFASVRTPLYNIDGSKTGNGFPCEVIALSPSHGDLLRFLERITGLMPESSKSKRSISAATPNEVSVATLVKVGGTTVLLGADLENSGRLTSGWEAVLENDRTLTFGARASLYKIAHHGSETAYNADVWAEMLIVNAYSVLTPWQKGEGRLPTVNGVKGILRHSREAFTTALNAHSRPQGKERSPSVMRHLRENRLRLRALPAEFGAVRFRNSNPATRQWQVELFGAACRLSSFLRRPGRRSSG